MRSKTLPGSTRAVEDVGQQFLDVGAGRSDAAGEGDVAEEHRRSPAGTSGYCGAPTRLTVPPARTTPNAVSIAGREADALQHGVGAVAAGQLAHLRDALLAALGDDVGGAELAAEVGAGLVPAHQDDLLGAEPLGRQHRAQPDRAVTDHRHRRPRVDAGRDRAVVAGREHVGQASAATAAAPSPRRPAASPACPAPAAPAPPRPGRRRRRRAPSMPPCRHEVCRPSRQKSQVLSAHTNGATTSRRSRARTPRRRRPRRRRGTRGRSGRPCSRPAASRRATGRCRRCTTAPHVRTTASVGSRSVGSGTPPPARRRNGSRFARNKISLLLGRATPPAQTGTLSTWSIAAGKTREDRRADRPLEKEATEPLRVGRLCGRAARHHRRRDTGLHAGRLTSPAAPGGMGGGVGRRREDHATAVALPMALIGIGQGLAFAPMTSPAWTATRAASESLTRPPTRSALGLHLVADRVAARATLISG